ncbi:NAD-dependent epimerase/dehydratase family protein [Streptomyces sp. NPDC001380]|uniref:NAD-dependent epimerase/dehydratase family protein n=1 Tax=Streptomyces sp. NPDC001380 TaxID=3364566 RepID=UPI0036C3BFA5
MRILVIGGTEFLGRAFVAQALERGDRVTTFNRGLSGPDAPGVETVRGDREVAGDLRALVEGRRWDAVVDTRGGVPKVVGETARILSGHADTYLFVSSCHAYADWPAEPVDERSPRHPCPPDAERGDVPPNALKAGCERAVEQHFDGGVLIVNPGLIVGPYDDVGRLPWWLERIARGGRVLAGGAPDRAMQLVDVRDIAAFMLGALSEGTTGRFLATGIRSNTTWGDLLRDCTAVTGSDAEPVWVDDAFLAERGVEPWTELPLWMPLGKGGDGVWLASSAAARERGFHCRPVAETVRDTWEWVRGRGADAGPWMQGETPLGIDPGKESRLLAEWDAAVSGRGGDAGS